MTYEEAIQIIEDDALYNPDVAKIATWAIGLHIPKKPIYYTPLILDEDSLILRQNAKCPTCGYTVSFRRCTCCGQLLDWD